MATVPAFPPEPSPEPVEAGNKRDAPRCYQSSLCKTYLSVLILDADGMAADRAFLPVWRAHFGVIDARPAEGVPALGFQWLTHYVHTDRAM